MMAHPTRVAQVRDLDGDDVDLIVRLVHLLGLYMRRLAEIHVGDVVREYLSETAHQSQQSNAIKAG